MSLRTTGACAGAFKVDETEYGYFPNVPIKDEYIHQNRLSAPFIGNFTQGAKAGEGGFGAVYRGTIGHNSQVVLKFPKYTTWQGNDVSNPHVQADIKTKFRKEAEHLQTLYEGPYAAYRFPAGTPYSISKYEYMQTIGKEVYQMRRHCGYQYIERIIDFNNEIPCIVVKSHFDSLREYKPHRKAWDSICKQLCSAVEYVHWMGFIHGDIKPANILYDPIGNDDVIICLTDFGFTTSVEKPTNKGGTKNYRAPEFKQEGTTSSKSTDYYAVVMTLLTLFDRDNFKFNNANVQNDAKDLLSKLQFADYTPKTLCKYMIDGYDNIEKRDEIYRILISYCIKLRPMHKFIPTPIPKRKRKNGER